MLEKSIKCSGTAPVAELICLISIIQKQTFTQWITIIHYFSDRLFMTVCVLDTHRKWTRKISLTQFRVWPSNLFSNVYRYIQCLCCRTLLMLARDVHDEGKIYCSYNVKSRLVRWGMKKKCLGTADKHFFSYYYVAALLSLKNLLTNGRRWNEIFI